MNLTIDEIDIKLKPRTPNERAALLALWTLRPDLTDADVAEIAQNMGWRTPIETLRGRDFCAKCDQHIDHEFCGECGLPLSLARAIDMLPPVPAFAKILADVATSLLRNYIEPEKALRVLHALNGMFHAHDSIFKLTAKNIEEIFVHAASLETERREQRGA